MKPLRLALVLLLLLPACADWTAAQLELVRQAERGVVSARRSAEAQAALLAAADEARRLELDAAFDADVRVRGGGKGLSAEWVVEARRAYAAGLALLDEQRRQHERAAEVDRRNALAAEAALARLRDLLETQAELIPGPPTPLFN